MRSSLASTVRRESAPITVYDYLKGNMTIEYVLYGPGKQGVESVITLDSVKHLPRASDLLYFHVDPKLPASRYLVERLEWHLDPSGPYSCQVLAVRI